MTFAWDHPFSNGKNLLSLDGRDVTIVVVMSEFSHGILWTSSL